MERVKLLIVDDEEDIREILKFNLESEGYLVDTASSGEEALEIISSEHKLVLLDVMMGGISGFHTAEKMRKDNLRVPIVFLSAKDKENDMLTGFSVGADDYIFKPFSINEVIARVKAILRRTAQCIPEFKQEQIIFRELRLDLRSKYLELDGNNVILTKKEFEILSLLMQHPQHIFTRSEILQNVWKGESYVLERTVDVHVARLRKKLNEYSICITNRSGYGYSFNDLAQIYPNES